MNIDWSKAPEGATHKDLKYAPTGFWYKFDFHSDTAAYCPHDEYQWVSSGKASEYANDGSMDDMAVRQAVTTSPNGATHKWSVSGQFAKRSGGKCWAVWQDHEWLWIGDEFRGEMVPLVDHREQTRQEIIDLASKRCGIAGDSIRQLATVLAAEGYRKFEIVEEDV